MVVQKKVHGGSKFMVRGLGRAKITALRKTYNACWTDYELMSDQQLQVRACFFYYFSVGLLGVLCM
jgi:hypothetical protein